MIIYTQCLHDAILQVYRIINARLLLFFTFPFLDLTLPFHFTNPLNGHAKLTRPLGPTRLARHLWCAELTRPSGPAKLTHPLGPATFGPPERPATFGLPNRPASLDPPVCPPLRIPRQDTAH
jgi:hypothetical protein